MANDDNEEENVDEHIDQQQQTMKGNENASEDELDGNTCFARSQTALHLAVFERNLQITRLLLCLGADPNVANAHGETPRHLAATLNEVDLLKSLIICVFFTFYVGCVSDCVNEKQLHELKRPSTSSMPSSATGNTTSTSTAASSSSSSSTTSASAAAAAAATAPPTQPTTSSQSAAGASTTAPKPTSYTSVMVEDFENRAFAKDQFRFNKLLDIQHIEFFGSLT
ncbi:hypothetical protein niasHS_013358 [Heterodera schachtii]|uniref:ANK_REP_REGION domain-containing protein n=1 Tax=Heterodera schachtii TaxID=97005 RepID=A0ABD2ID31_HETSC